VCTPTSGCVRALVNVQALQFVPVFDKVTEVSHAAPLCPCPPAAPIGIDSLVVLDDWSGQRVAHGTGPIQQVTRSGVSDEVINTEQPSATRYVYSCGPRAAERS
jgi:hypothetical protein